MSYKSLLFCPDEKTAGILTQILTELEFAVESAHEPFGAVKKLNDGRFDALVVDCQNEQDAALLFKTARDSAQNHSSLSVAVVEGQMGVAKAFRIGANLVLTKPINAEQSKGTLRVARGLLRKNSEAKPAEAPAPKPAAPPSISAPAVQAPVTPVVSAPVYVPAPPPQPEAPFSAFQVEADPTPATEAAEAALLESLPDVGGKLAHASVVATPHIEAVPVAASTSSQAAAAALALDKTPLLGSTAASAAPMVTNEPIVPEQHYEEPIPPPAVEVPSFSSLENAGPHGTGGAGKFFKFAATVAVVFVAGYYAWQKIQPLQYLQNFRAAHTADTSQAPQPRTTPQETIAPPPSSATASPASSSQSSSGTPASSSTSQPAIVLEPPPTVEPENDTPEATDAAPKDVSHKNDKIETIEVQEMHMPGDPKPTAPKPQVLMVKPDLAGRRQGKTALAPPQVQVSSLNPSSSVLPNLTSVEAAVPKLAPGAVKVSQGVSQGFVVKKVPPAYPPMALQMHKEGSVELLATISKQGSINDVKVLSGDTMLAKAAADAVRQWKYRPYLLNGEPVDIQTQITIVFKAPH